MEDPIKESINMYYREMEDLKDRLRNSTGYGNHLEHMCDRIQQCKGAIEALQRVNVYVTLPQERSVTQSEPTFETKVLDFMSGAQVTPKKDEKQQKKYI